MKNCFKKKLHQLNFFLNDIDNIEKNIQFSIQRLDGLV